MRKYYKKDYIFTTTIKLYSRINAKSVEEGKNIWYKELKKELKTDKIDYCPTKGKIYLHDIVLNREVNKIYGDDISTIEHKKIKE